MSSSRGSSQPRDCTCVSCIAGRHVLASDPLLQLVLLAHTHTHTHICTCAVGSLSPEKPAELKILLNLKINKMAFFFFFGSKN